MPSEGKGDVDLLQKERHEGALGGWSRSPLANERHEVTATRQSTVTSTMYLPRLP